MGCRLTVQREKRFGLRYIILVMTYLGPRGIEQLSCPGIFQGQISFIEFHVSRSTITVEDVVVGIQGQGLSVQLCRLVKLPGLDGGIALADFLQEFFLSSLPCDPLHAICWIALQKQCDIEMLIPYFNTLRGLLLSGFPRYGETGKKSGILKCHFPGRESREKVGNSIHFMILTIKVELRKYSSYRNGRPLFVLHFPKRNTNR